jgi:ABC-2 type transport system permease protein
MNRRLFSLIRKEFIQIVRDPRTLYITIAIPVIQLFCSVTPPPATCAASAGGLRPGSQPARRLLDAYRAADYFTLAYDANSESELRTLIDGGQARAGFIIPHDYGESLLAGRTARVTFVLDGSDPNSASTSLAAAQLIGQAHATGILVERLGQQGLTFGKSPPVEVATHVWYNPDMISAFFMIPALIGMILQLLTSMLTATAIVRERERGTIEQLIVTPIRSWELILGKIIPYVLIAFLDTLEILVVGTWWFKVPIRGDLGVLLALSGLFLISSLGIGLFISTVARTQQEAMMLAYFTMLPTIFLSGFFFPLNAMPVVLQWVSHLVPLRYYLIIIRSVILKGVGIEALLPEVIALALFGVVLMGAAALRFRKRLD